MEIWLSSTEVSSLTGWPDRTIRHRAANGELRWKEADEPAANGKRPRLYDLNSLPSEAQLSWAKSQMHSITATKTPTGEAITRTRETVPSSQQEVVAQRFDIIKPLIEMSSGLRPAGIPPQIKSKRALVAYLMQQHKLSHGTLWNWMKAWRESKHLGLTNAVRADKGKSRFFEDHPLAAQFVLAKFAERISYQLIYEALVREWPKIYPGVSRAPSYATVRAYLVALPQPARDFVRRSKQEHESRNAPYLITDIAKVRVNQVWVCDHRVYDVLVVNDCFATAPRLAAIRLWHTAIEDMRSRVIVGSVIGTTPSSRSIAACLKQSIANYGMPETFYCDNGKDFRKIGNGAELGPALDEEGRVFLDPLAASLLAGLGIRVTYCIPRHPQSKMVESFFHTVSARFDMIWGNAYAGSKPALRPDSARMAELQHKKFLLDKRASTPLPAASEFCSLALFWLDEYNRLHKHGGRGMAKRAPLEVMDALMPIEQRRMIDVGQIEEFFWETKSLRVANATVKLKSLDIVYQGADEIEQRHMYDANGSDLVIKYDPYNMARAKAFDQDGRLVAQLACQELVERDSATSHDQIAAMIRHRKNLDRTQKQAWDFITQDVPTELDFMRARAGVSKVSVSSPSAPQLPPDVPRLAAVNGEPARPAASNFSGGSLKIDRREIGSYFAEKE